MRERIPLLGGLALIAIAFVIGAVAIGHGIRDRNQNDVIVVTGSASPILVTGLTNGIAYTFTVTASNVLGTSPASVSNAVTPVRRPSVPPPPPSGTGIPDVPPVPAVGARPPKPPPH